MGSGLELRNEIAGQLSEGRLIVRDMGMFENLLKLKIAHEGY